MKRPCSLLARPLWTLFLSAALAAAQWAAQGSVAEPRGSSPLPGLAVVYLHPDYALAGALGDGGSQPDGLVACYANDRQPDTPNSLQFGQFVGAGYEILDWGIKRCGTSGWIGALGLGYVTGVIDQAFGGPGAKFGIRIYDGTTGGPGGRGVLVAELMATGFPGIAPGGQPAAITGVAGLGLPFRLPDGPIGYSLFDIGDGTGTVPLLVQTAGGQCALPGDPLTGTLDCLDTFIGGVFNASLKTGIGKASIYLQLLEENAVVTASTTAFNFGTNPFSYSAGRAVLGETWHASVAVGWTGHQMALVFGLDSLAVIPLSGGQTLLAFDGGNGELFGFGPRPGPLATFQASVPPLPGLIGFTVHSQALHFGGPVPFRLSNRQSLLIGTR